jgi:hypothetical protein
MECHRNIEVIWLLRGLRPDFKTIADFRRNRGAFRSVFAIRAMLSIETLRSERSTAVPSRGLQLLCASYRDAKRSASRGVFHGS